VGQYFVTHFMVGIGKAETFHLYKTKISKQNPNEPFEGRREKRERENIRAASCSAYSSTLKMEEIHSSATPENVSRLRFTVTFVRTSNITA
jgi:hypothetical protein